MRTILQIALPTPLNRLFDYLSNQKTHLSSKQTSESCDSTKLKPGIRINVPFGRRNLIGILVGTSQDSKMPAGKLKPINEALDDTPVITTEILSLCEWASQYYHHPLGEILLHALPTLLRKGHSPTLEHPKYWTLTLKGKQANIELLKRFPKQYTAMNILKNSASALSHKNLLSKGVPHSTIKSLEKKGFITLTLLSTSKKNQPAQDRLVLNQEQQAAIEKISLSLRRFRCFLLDGITGSGKTEVYLKIIEKNIAQNKQTIVLVPEIALTPQSLQRFQNRFNTLIVSLHSGLNDKERLQNWLLAKSGEAKIIIGTRSAIFTPCKNLGLIILDEEHDLSFKQQDHFRYSARTLAIVRAHHNRIPIILGSATPSLEMLYNTFSLPSYERLSLTKRAGNAIHPLYQIIDVRNTSLDHGLSEKLIATIKQHLEKENQVLLFLNRRGYAPTLMCYSCGWIAGCHRCDAHMVLHHAPPRLHCHHCDTIHTLPQSCPHCQNKNLQPIGSGTERIEEALKIHFPTIPVLRIDRDTTRRKNAIENIIDQIQQGHRQILIGTQMIAKGHHFPNVTLVGILNADSGFFSADFRTSERIGQLLVQVAGRSGRADRPGKVLIQTHHPDHPLLLQLIKNGYHHFAKLTLQERKEALLPPFSHFVLLRAESMKEHLSKDFLNQIKDLVKSFKNKEVSILGPIPSQLSRRKGHFRFQLLLQAEKRAPLQILLKKLLPKIDNLKITKKIKWSIDVDPMEMY